MEILWLPKYRKHCSGHHAETPEICPAFIEQILMHGDPSRVYPDKVFTHRHIFEGYFPPIIGRPYRVVFEVSDEQKVVPVSCWRIKPKDFVRKR